MNLFDSNLEIAAREADIFDEAIDETTHALSYIGFFQNGDSTKCLIKKIEKNATITTVTYPNGRRSFDQDWAQRAALNYLPKQ